MDTEEQALRAELLEFYGCQHKLFGSFDGEARFRDIERRLFALTNPQLAARIGNTFRLDRVLGDLPDDPPPASEPGPPGRWDWSEEDPAELKQS